MSVQAPVCARSGAARAQVLRALPDDGSLERFRSEYAKLFQAVRGAHGASAPGAQLGQAASDMQVRVSRPSADAAAAPQLGRSMWKRQGRGTAYVPE